MNKPNGRTLKALVAVIAMLWSAVVGLGGIALGTAKGDDRSAITRLETQVVEVNRRLSSIEAKLDALR